MPAVKCIQIHLINLCICRKESRCNRTYFSWIEQLNSLLGNIVTLLSTWPFLVLQAPTVLMVKKESRKLRTEEWSAQMIYLDYNIPSPSSIKTPLLSQEHFESILSPTPLAQSSKTRRELNHLLFKQGFGATEEREGDSLEDSTLLIVQDPLVT